MGNGAKFVQSFHATKNVFFWRFALEKLQNGHCQFTAYIVKDLKNIVVERFFPKKKIANFCRIFPKNFARFFFFNICPEKKNCEFLPNFSQKFCSIFFSIFVPKKFLKTNIHFCYNFLLASLAKIRIIRTAAFTSRVPKLCMIADP